jgi:hypothetical protein
MRLAPRFAAYLDFELLGQPFDVVLLENALVRDPQLGFLYKADAQGVGDSIGFDF